MKIERPIIKLEPDNRDKLLDLLTWVLLVIIWGHIIFTYGSLPQIIPVHFNLQGKADRFGDKATVWIMPCIATVIVCGITVLNKYPHIFNYPVTLTIEDAPRQYMLATRLLRYLKLNVAIVFLFIDLTMTSDNIPKGWGVWFTVALFLLFMAPTVIYLIQSLKKTPKK